MQSITENTHRDQYRENGFFTVPSFLNSSERNELVERLKSKIPNREGFYTSTCIEDEAYRKFCNNVISEMVSIEKINRFIGGYAVFYANFINKTAHSNSEVCLHTDWSIVDESDYSPFKLWIPLVDVNAANGGFALVAGSHKLTNKYRGFGAKEYYMEYTKDILAECLTSLELNAGDALFYHPGLLHYSPPNLSNTDRPALLVSLYAENTQPVLYYKNWYDLFNAMSVYKFVPDFMNIWNKQSKPAELEYIRKVREHNPKLSKSEFIDQLKVARYA